MANPTTFLECVQRTYRECGLSNNAPSAVVDQTGMAQKVVDWVLAAHAWLQNEEERWRFDWAQVTKVLASGVDTIDPVADWAITVKEWVTSPMSAYIYKTATGVISRQELHYIDWEIFRGLNIPPVSSTTPIYWTINPQAKLVYFPKPNSGDWTAVHEYYQDEQTMSAAGDTPRIPAKYRMAIVWRAVQLYCGHDGAADLRQHANAELRDVMEKMRNTELPMYLSPGSLA
jgi:hypothetical protein